MNVSFLCNIYASCGGTGTQYDYIQRRPISVHSATHEQRAKRYRVSVLSNILLRTIHFCMSKLCMKSYVLKIIGCRFFISSGKQPAKSLVKTAWIVSCTYNNLRSNDLTYFFSFSALEKLKYGKPHWVLKNVRFWIVGEISPSVRIL